LNISPHYIFLFTTLIAGFNYSISKILMPQYISPSAIIVVRSISAVLFFSLLYLFSTKQKVNQRDFWRLVLAAFLGIAANQLLFMEGLNKTSPINASLMMTSAPVLVLLTSIWMKKERFTIYKLIGLVCAGMGALMLLAHSMSIDSHEVMLGDVYILLNAACWALFLVVIKPIITKYHTTTVMPILYLLGLMFVLPFGWQDFIHTNFRAFSIEAWLALGFVIVFATWIAYFLNIYGLKHVNPSAAGVYIYLQPVFSTIISITMGKDELNFEKVVFSIFIFVGIYLVGVKTTPRKVV
jgi:drug/metabolite transporter (DMT)-like permease